MSKELNGKFKDDWRLSGWYEGELDGKTFEYKKFVTEGTNDHEHCVFCFQKITDLDMPDVDKYGYYATDADSVSCRWICKQCFNDFAELFGFCVATYEDIKGENNA